MVRQALPAPYCGNKRMPLLKPSFIAGLLLVISSAAFAFQEQTAGGGAAPAPAAAASGQTKALSIEQPDVRLPSTAGTEVRVPGLGKLGVLPKMDFGLELLYGASDAKRQDPAGQPRDDNRDDLTIRGTVKHSF
jgi:hypothetical protein